MGSTDPHAAEIDAIVRRLEREAGFHPLVPAYVPSDVNPVPLGQAISSSPNPQVILTYSLSPPDEHSTTTPKEPFVGAVIIVQLGNHDAAGCPPKLKPNDRELTLDGYRVVEEQTRSEFEIEQDLRALVKDICVIAKLIWEFPELAPDRLDDSMRAEGEKVIQSMMAPLAS